MTLNTNRQAGDIIESGDINLIASTVNNIDTKANQAVSTADAAYAYNQALVGVPIDIVNAVVTDPASEAGALVAGKADRSDTEAALAQRVTVAEGPYDVHRAGPIGSGDDTATIRAAITAAGDGGHLRFRPGVTYLVSGALVPQGGQAWYMSGSTLKVKPGASAAFNTIQPNPGRGPVTLLDPTFDGSRSEVGWTASESTGSAVAISPTGSGWNGEFVLRNVTARDCLGNAVRIQGATSTAMPAVGTDAALTPWSRVRIDGMYTDQCRRALWVDRAAGVTITNVDFNRSDRDHLYQYLTRAMSVRGGRLRDAGVSGNQTGHAAVDQYGLGTIWADMESVVASYNGFCLGGGHVDTYHARGTQWSNLTSSGSAGSGFSLDPTLALPTADRPGHTLDVSAILTGLHGYSNSAHGLYLHSTANVQVNGPIMHENGASGLAGDAYNTSVNGGALYGNPYGLNLQGVAGHRSDGSPAGKSGVYTGYGAWRVSRQTRMTGNTAADLLIAHTTSGYHGSVLELMGPGSPEAVHPGTVGSTYLDTQTGDLWVKTSLDTTSIGTTRLGWKQVATA